MNVQKSKSVETEPAEERGECEEGDVSGDEKLSTVSTDAMLG